MNQWKYETFSSLSFGLKEKLTIFPREKDMIFSGMRLVWNALMRLWLKCYFRLKIQGREHLPKDQSYILIANHASHLDAVCLSAALPIRSIETTFSLAAKDYFFNSFFRSFLAAVCINAIPFERKKSPRQSLELCADALAVSRQTLILFPEGTRSPDGEIQPFKGGLGFLTAGSSCLVVPAYIDGAFGAWPKESSIPKPKKIVLRIGKPLSFADVERTKEGFAQIAQRAQQAVIQLKGNL